MKLLGGVFSREQQLMKLDKMLLNDQTPDRNIKRHAQLVLKRVTPDESQLKKAIISACTARRPDIQL